MEMVLNNGFCEMSQDEMMVVDGGKAWYKWLGDIGGAVCAGAAVVAFAPASTVAVGWGIVATGGAALWQAVN